METIHVLIVEDNDQVAGIIRLQLQQRVPQLGEIRCVQDGEAALATCRQFEPRVVVMDHGLPGISGDEAAQGIRELHPRTQIVSFSGGDEPAPWADRIVRKDPAGFRNLAQAVIDLIGA